MSSERTPDGGWLLWSRTPLGEREHSVGAMLRRWAQAAPDRPVVAERDADGGWRRVTYAEAWQAARGLAQALLERGLGPQRPVAVLSGNSVAHALLMLGCFTAGVPIVPVSAAYSLQSRDFAKLRQVLAVASPALVYVSDSRAFAGALGTLDPELEVIAAAAAAGDGATPFAELLSTAPGPETEAAFGAVGPDTVAKVLFTSGSTGRPKGVITTHRMLCANQQAWRRCGPSSARRHQSCSTGCRGATRSAAAILQHGAQQRRHAVHRRRPPRAGTPGAHGAQPPRGVADRVLQPPRWVRRAAAGAGGRRGARRAVLLPPAGHLLRRRVAVARPVGAPEPAGGEARARRGRDDHLLGRHRDGAGRHLGHFPLTGPGNIGVPLPGLKVKLAPVGAKLELRVRGPNVTPGYLGRPDLTTAAFDEDGFYRTGDAGALVEPDDANRGIVFAGRIAEEFKLATGTWVSAGAVRTAALAAVDGLLQDAVVTGHDRPYLGLLAWINAAAVRRSLPESVDHADPAAVACCPEVVRAVRAGLGSHNARSGGSSTRIARVLLLTEPPSLDAGEITDKGYINQRAALDRRQAEVNRLYDPAPAPDVIEIRG